MILAVLPQHRARFATLLQEMHQLRYRVFEDRLGWEVTTSGGLEFDEYDSLAPIYLLHLTSEGQVGGCARLLPTTGPTMLSRTFPILLDGQPMPSDPRIWESSRFAVDLVGAGSDHRRNIAQATIELFAGLAEFGLRMGWRQIVTVTDLRLERLGARAGLAFERFGPPRQIGRTQAVAGRGQVSEDTLAAVRAYGGLDHPVLETSDTWVAPQRLAA